MIIRVRVSPAWVEKCTTKTRTNAWATVRKMPLIESYTSAKQQQQQNTDFFRVKKKRIRSSFYERMRSRILTFWWMIMMITIIVYECVSFATRLAAPLGHWPQTIHWCWLQHIDPSQCELSARIWSCQNTENEWVCTLTSHSKCLHRFLQNVKKSQIFPDTTHIRPNINGVHNTFLSKTKSSSCTRNGVCWIDSIVQRTSTNLALYLSHLQIRVSFEWVAVCERLCMCAFIERDNLCVQNWLGRRVSYFDSSNSLDWTLHSHWRQPDSSTGGHRKKAVQLLCLWFLFNFK